jgi:predicted TIM-barrel fold metal-dependent hydrolase
MVEYELVQVLGFLLDTSLAMARLIFGGVMERFPKIRFVLPHLGSTLPYVMGRIDTSSGNIPGSRERLRKPPSEYFREVYLDTVSLHPPALKLACDFHGTDKILFASDRPWWSLQRAVESILDLALPRRDKERIFSENALRLLRISPKGGEAQESKGRPRASPGR